MKKSLAVLLAALTATLSACSLDATTKSDDVVDVVVGYQSKTINTVTAGTLLKAQGYLEHRLADISAKSGT
ncbi:MAG TPA: ABC transporter substrate-binding protein, partial [Mycobacterium sp.]|nr:ABC transporter substrate-binding protein [Mycobacterium sp.]